LRTFSHRRHLQYEVRRDHSHDEPFRVAADDVVAVRGTAWPDMATLLAARAAAGIDLDGAEILDGDVLRRGTAGILDPVGEPPRTPIDRHDFIF
jgi:hypothetical protein